MEGYAAILSIKLITQRLLELSDISEFLGFACKKFLSSREIIERMFWSGSLVPEIKVAVSKLEAFLKPIDSRSINGDEIQSSMLLQDLEQEIHSFFETLKMEEEYIKEEEEEVVSSRIEFGGNKSKMVGLSDVYNELKCCLTRSIGIFSIDRPRIVTLVGMPGIGKTTIAKEVFEAPEIVKHFDCRVRVKLGKCQLKEIPRRILAQLNPDHDQVLLEEDEDIAYEYLKASLEGKRYLIVLDDVWSKYLGRRLQLSYLHERNGSNYFFPDNENGSRVLLTTRLKKVDRYIHEFPFDVLTMRLMTKEESWDLLCERMFGKELCSPQLEKAGKKIAENCDGLPLTIITVADLLSKEEKTLEYWSMVATQRNHQLFKTAYDEISKVLLSSYKYLPQLLRTCFLYLGVFPQDYEIPQSKLIDMWKADGFLEQNVQIFLSPGAINCLEELVFNSLVMIYQRTMDGVQIKTCGLHSSLWHLSNREARKTKFSRLK